MPDAMSEERQVKERALGVHVAPLPTNPFVKLVRFPIWVGTAPLKPGMLESNRWGRGREGEGEES